MTTFDPSKNHIDKHQETRLDERRNFAIYTKPIMDLLSEAATIHREQHDPNVVQVSTLFSIKTKMVITWTHD